VTAALWMLIGLQIKGWGRYFVRNLGTVKGALFALVGMLVFGFWLSAMLFGNRTQIGIPAERIRAYGPAILLIYCLLNVVLSTSEKSIYFTPAEINYLFCGPFSRRQILAYKILSTVLLGLPTTLVMALIFQIHAPSYLSAYVGLFFMFLFMNLFTVALNLIATTIGANLYSRMRQVVIIGVLVLVGGYLLIGGGQAVSGLQPAQIMDQLNASVVWRILTLPLSSFFEVFLAEHVWPTLLVWSLPALLVNAVLIGVVFWLDANYLETAATASERIYTRLQKIRAGNIFASDDNKGRKVRFGLPLPPHWGGVGPILWRQMTTALRGLGRLAFLFVMFAISMMAMLGTLSEQKSAESILSMLLGMGFMTFFLTLMLTTLVPFDFRGDVDRMDVLKSLPIQAWCLSLGQLLTPTLLVAALQWLVMALVMAVLLVRPIFTGGHPIANDVLGRMVLGMAVVSAFIPPFNFLLFGLDNLFFLLFPTRIIGTQAADFQAMGRNVLIVLAKMFVIGLVVGVAVAVGAVLYFVPNSNMMVSVAGAWFVLTCSASFTLPLVAGAFKRFDVGRDTPP
jgi:Putative ABC exporter